MLIPKSSNTDPSNNCKPISVLPCFPNILEKFIYSRVYNYLNEDNLLFQK